MKNFFTSLILILLLLVFSVFNIEHGKSKEVLEVFSPTKIGIDFNDDRIINSDEIICIEDIESFSLTPTDKFVETYTNKLGITANDIINLGYLAQEFAQKEIWNRRVTVKLTPKTSSECRYADIKLNGIEYSKILTHSGFGIKNGDIIEKTKFEQELEKSKKLHLVVLNHNSNKYHTLDCEYGKLAHDKVILPEKQLPKDALPCRSCHHEEEKLNRNNIIPVSYNKPSPQLVHSDGNITLYYTDFTKHLKPDSNCQTNECKAFIKLVNEAKDTIDIAIYGYDEVPIITTALQNAQKRGVRIRFVYDVTHNPANTFYKNNSVIEKLSSEFRSDKSNTATKSNMIMHNKFVIFDDSKVFTGSMNFSKTGLSGYDENDVIIINSKEVANLYKHEFEQMLSGKFHKDKFQHKLSNRFQLGNTGLEVYFSPQDKSSKRIIELINSSKKYIYMPTFLVTHQGISNALIDAFKRGIDVKIIMDANNTSTRNTKHQLLRENGVPLKTENYAGKLHSKTMIIDDKYIVMGSMNFSNSGENKNDENMLVLTNTSLAKDYREFFNYLWQIIPDKYLKYNARAESYDSIGSCNDGIDNNFNGKIDSYDEGCKVK